MFFKKRTIFSFASFQTHELYGFFFSRKEAKALDRFAGIQRRLYKIKPRRANVFGSFFKKNNIALQFPSIRRVRNVDKFILVSGKEESINRQIDWSF
jgi:hypothetical protein